ncbi:16S rRNA (adenine(1518)-N(6)/adenine(1519)-N(6))-dimethyltransferase RsmA, partial [Candidatus Peregrinibacteria bacterium]|nr:16S rRNA (adenine(1518)-N(6)/adenine(1519)-N(6))-dimethyltransferase RsmA [Candidatus Peregrinibacteria bacterium]
YPAPKVDSSILLLETLPSPRLAKIELFLKLIKMAFSQKRKTLLNTLSNFPGVNKQTLENTLNKIGISPMVRPQNLTFEEWKKLTELFATF